MAKSVFFFFLAVSLLLLLLAAASTAAAAGNATSELIYGGCARGDTVGECITAEVEEEGVEAVVGRILEQQRKRISYGALQKQPALKCNKIAGNCIGTFYQKKKKKNCIGTVNKRNAPCTYYDRCKRATS
ncbi:unnamed protein product [Eruca vesicaria subsp. sativa]|uniref:Protein RALF-like 27 n=1 Tax=Eruca vesicaria subsp. sativa TaxID=29727 RepID=A0ABC8KVY4_ERUVS|nr:unnamed protein product [Eruca vesicaria subsp. sativa]